MSSLEGVAIIGVAGRFPGARNVNEFWKNLVNGVESITRFTEAELEVGGEAIQQPNYVRARGVLEDVDGFDPGFFNITPREAELTDPQHRVLLECAWEALENAGHDPERFTGAIGVYAGCSLNTYLLNNLCSDRTFIEGLLAGHQMSTEPALLGNDKDFLATRIAYKLNLRGPCVAVQTACSTSLVAIVQACQSLLSYQCDMALAGGVSISSPQKRGYLYQEGAMVSSDGKCRPFDSAAEGTVFGGGAGLLVLRRLEEAVADRDHIIAVIKGAALNNDGAGKASYMAPSVNGQAEVISLAQALAGASAESISYVEAHGTGTPLGDPIEVAGLTQAFRTTTQQSQFCGLGSVKSNVGHLESAAGVAGVIKAALALKNKVIPPTLHFQQPNPKCEFDKSPFYVVSKLTEWKDVPLPRRAGVSSFGIGGTNAHVVLEEGPETDVVPSARPAQLLVLSAKSEAALDRATLSLIEHLSSCAVVQGGAPLADVAYTLQTGRRRFDHRRIVAAAKPEEAIELLQKNDPKRVFAHAGRGSEARVAFVFPGQGAQYVNMGRQLYESEPTFHQQVDQCASVLQPALGLDIRTVLFPGPGDESKAAAMLRETSLTQPALFVIEYALAKLWMSWGIKPAALVGHSVGEYVAAVLAGVMSLEDALLVIAERARLMQSVASGGMLSVRLPANEVQPLLTGSLSIAASNSSKLCVVSGPHEELVPFKNSLEDRGIACKALHTSHAFHSPMMEPVVKPFVERVSQIKLSAPRIPIVSTYTGDWIQPGDWTDPAYWGKQLRHTVKFAEAAGQLMKQGQFILLEVGPGQTLTTLSQQHPDRPKDRAAIASMPVVEDPNESAALLTALGRLWLAGAAVDWSAFHANEKRFRVPCPSYPFERRRCWVEPARAKSRVPGHSPSITAAAPGAQSAGTETGSVSTVEQVIGQQLEIMRQQLEALGNSHV